MFWIHIGHDEEEETQMETKSLNLCGGDVRQKLDFLDGSYENEASNSNTHSPTFSVGSNVISKDGYDLGTH